MRQNEVKRYNDYDAFAYIYNLYWGPRSRAKAIPLLKRLLLNELPPPANILDLCCGSGHVTQALIEEGYKVTGLDGSGELLKFAKANAPEARFVLDDARSFRLSSDFDAVICLNDSLNHVMKLEEIQRVFQNVFLALRKGGVFLFDLNLPHKYVTSWVGSFAIVERDHVCAIQTHVDLEKKVADFVAAMFFQRNNQWERSDVTLYQTWYEVSEIIDALHQAGFKEIEVKDTDGNSLVVEDVDKAFFLCRKP